MNSRITYNYGEKMGCHRSNVDGKVFNFTSILTFESREIISKLFFIHNNLYN